MQVFEPEPGGVCMPVGIKRSRPAQLLDTTAYNITNHLNWASI